MIGHAGLIFRSQRKAISRRASSSRFVSAPWRERFFRRKPGHAEHSPRDPSGVHLRLVAARGCGYRSTESYSGFSSASRAAMPSSLLRLLQRGRTSSKPIKVKPSEESPSGKVCRTLGWRRGDEQAAQGDGAVGRMQQGYLVRLVGCGLFLHKLDRFLNVSLCLSVRDVSL
jgi:hypothetical protein